MDKEINNLHKSIELYKFKIYEQKILIKQLKYKLYEERLINASYLKIKSKL